MSKITIRCFDVDFPFINDLDESAWYNFDHACSSISGKQLLLNADREVYGIYTDENGGHHYGTIGDLDNEVLADNYPCEETVQYLFYENPRTKDYYV